MIKDKFAKEIVKHLTKEQKQEMVNKFTAQYKDHPDFEKLIKVFKEKLGYGK